MYLTIVAFENNVPCSSFHSARILSSLWWRRRGWIVWNFRSYFRSRRRRKCPASKWPNADSSGKLSDGSSATNSDLGRRKNYVFIHNHFIGNKLCWSDYKTLQLTRPDTRHKMRLARDILRSTAFILDANGHTDQRTDPRTDGRRDTPSYRDATAHLKKT